MRKRSFACNIIWIFVLYAIYACHVGNLNRKYIAYFLVFNDVFLLKIHVARNADKIRYLFFVT